MSCCPECGESHERKGRFCRDAHKRAYNQRRYTRGAELYDVVMAFRFERGLAKALKLMTVLSRMATHWRAEDKAQRNGRRSWNDAREILRRKVFLSADVKHLQ